MLAHISIGVRDIDRSKRFYDATLEPLGYKCLRAAKTLLGYGYGRDSIALWVVHRVSKAPSRTTTATATAGARPPTARRGRGRPPRAAATKSAGSKPSAPSLGERVLALATGRTRQELYVACPNDRPNHVGIGVLRHLRAGRIQERDGKLYATSL